MGFLRKQNKYHIQLYIMVGFMCNNIVEEQAAVGKKENGDSVVHGQHRRSKRCNFSTEIIIVIFSVMNMLSKSVFIYFILVFIYLSLVKWMFAFLSSSSSSIFLWSFSCSKNLRFLLLSYMGHWESIFFMCCIWEEKQKFTQKG